MHVEAQRFMDCEDPQYFLPIVNEVTLDAVVEIEGVLVHLTGIVDRMFADESGRCHIHELKTGMWKNKPVKWNSMREEMAYYVYLLDEAEHDTLGNLSAEYWGWDHTGGDSLFRGREPVTTKPIENMMDSLKRLVRTHKMYKGDNNGKHFPLIDKYMIKSQDPNMLLWWTLVILGLHIAEAFLRFLSSYFSNLFAQSIIRDVRKQLMKHILTFRIKYFDKTPVGTLITRIVSDLEAITEVFSSGMIVVAGEILTLIFSIALMFYTNWELALLVLIPIPILLLATRIFARLMRKSFQLEAKQVTKLNVFVQERITGMSLVQLFNRQEKEYSKFQEINNGHKQAHLKAVWATSIFFPVVELLSSISIAIMLVWGALQIQGKSSIEIREEFGEIISFILWVHMLYRPIRMLADKFNILQKGTVRAERVFEVLIYKIIFRMMEQLLIVNLTQLFVSKICISDTTMKNGF